MKRSALRWVALGVTAVLATAYTVTYALVGRFLDDYQQPDWGLPDDEDF